jgi:hypothetical protein
MGAIGPERIITGVNHISALMALAAAIRVNSTI